MQEKEYVIQHILKITTEDTTTAKMTKVSLALFSIIII